MKVPRTPPIRNASTPAPARAEPSAPSAVGLLLAVVVVGDQRHERRHQGRAGHAGQHLRGEHEVGDRAEGHQHLCDAEQRHHGAEHDHRSETLVRAWRPA